MAKAFETSNIWLIFQTPQNREFYPKTVNFGVFTILGILLNATVFSCFLVISSFSVDPNLSKVLKPKLRAAAMIATALKISTKLNYFADLFLRTTTKSAPATRIRLAPTIVNIIVPAPPVSGSLIFVLY